jgi:hypothetical protein
MLLMAFLMILNLFLTYFSPFVTPPYSVTTDFLHTACVSAAEISWAVKRLKPSKCVSLDDIPSFITKGCSDIFITLLTYIFNLIVASDTFPSLWKHTVAVLVFKKGSCTIVGNYLEGGQWACSRPSSTET